MHSGIFDKLTCLTTLYCVTRRQRCFYCIQSTLVVYLLHIVKVMKIDDSITQWGLLYITMHFVYHYLRF